MKLFACTAALATLVATLTGCAESESPTTAAPATATTWMLASAPADALPVVQAKSTATEGDTIVIRGRIGGRAEPISADSSVFTIVDLVLPHCGENPEDKCRKPWDYCCETPETIMANTATIQLVDADGNALTVDPIAAGLNPLDIVIVTGTVGPRPTGDVLTIRATGVHKEAS